MRGRTILVPVDDSSRSKAAAERALSIARGRGGRLWLLHGHTFPAAAIEADVRTELMGAFREAERRRFDEFCRAFEARGVEVTRSFVERDPVAAIEAAVDGSAGSPLIVLGSRGRKGLERLVLGSIAEQALESIANATLLVVREEIESAQHPLRSILFATDFSASSRAAEPLVAEWAIAFGAEVEVLHVLRETAVLFAPYAVVGSRDLEGEMLEAAEQRMKRVLERFRAMGVEPRSRMAHGCAAEEILFRAESIRADLIAVGRRGYSALPRFLLGSVSQRVLRHAACSVLIVGDRRRAERDWWLPGRPAPDEDLELDRGARVSERAGRGGARAWPPRAGDSPR